MNLPAKHQMEWHDILINPPAAPPLEPIVFCLVRVTARIGLAIGFLDFLSMKGNPNGISQQSPPST